eukprot:2158127-Rhodomonas_salina.1
MTEAQSAQRDGVWQYRSAHRPSKIAQDSTRHGPAHTCLGEYRTRPRGASRTLSAWQLRILAHNIVAYQFGISDTELYAPRTSCKRANAAPTRVIALQIPGPTRAFVPRTRGPIRAKRAADVHTPEIKDTRPPFQDNLHQKCGFNGVRVWDLERRDGGEREREREREKERERGGCGKRGGREGEGEGRRGREGERDEEGEGEGERGGGGQRDRERDPQRHGGPNKPQSGWYRNTPEINCPPTRA